MRLNINQAILCTSPHSLRQKWEHNTTQNSASSPFLLPPASHSVSSCPCCFSGIFTVHCCPPIAVPRLDPLKLTTFSRSLFHTYTQDKSGN
uniref:Uncharacterized protein n=1 Tax=Anguilla anguilla TaxID=7936 RepID=A0A0E9R9V4_ANGAN